MNARSIIRVLRREQRKKQKREVLENVAWARFYPPKWNVQGQVVAMHGYGDGIEAFLPLIHECWGNGYSVVAPELPGHGRSNGKRGDVHGAEEAKLLCRALTLYLLRGTKGKRVPTILVGYSTGALGILLFLVEHPFVARAISKVVLISPPLNVAINASRYARMCKPFMGIFRVVLGSVKVPTFFMQEPMRVGKNGLVAHNPMSYQGKPPFHFAIDMFCTSEDMHAKIQGWKQMPVPTCVIHGTEDTRACFKTAYEVFGNKSNVQFVPVIGAGHYLWGEAPRFTVETALSYIVH